MAVDFEAQPARLKARDLAVRPPGATELVVRGFSLDVAPGEWVALEGSNGSGKSTLLHALAGLWPVASGQLELNGRSFGCGREPTERSTVAVVLQDPSSQLIQPSVRDEIAFAPRNLGVPAGEVDRRIEQLRAELQLEEDWENSPSALSAGRQQLVLVAAALASAPGLLLADEAAAHLDSANRRRVLECVSNFARRGTSVIWVTQDPEEREAANRVVSLESGRDPRNRHDDNVFAPCVGRLARIEIAPPSGRSGPRIEVDTPLEILLPARGIVAVVGPNGAGKSALLAAVAGLDPLDQVMITWESRPSHPPSIASQFPELQIFEEHVEDELAFSAVARGSSRSDLLGRAAAAFEELGLDSRSFLKRRIWQLAGGEKRLVEVVGALLAPSDLVILDEPTAGLDPGRRNALMGLVAARARAASVLVATQDHDWVARLGGRTVPLGNALRRVSQVTT